MALIGLAIWAGSPCSKDGWQLLERCVWVSLISAAVNNTGMEKISLQDLYPPCHSPIGKRHFIELEPRRIELSNSNPADTADTAELLSSILLPAGAMTTTMS